MVTSLVRKATTEKRRPITAYQRFESFQRWQTDRVNDDQWSDIIEAWNGMNRNERQTFADTCREVGHVFVDTPIDRRMCLRCIKYIEADS